MSTRESKPYHEDLYPIQMRIARHAFQTNPNPPNLTFLTASAVRNIAYQNLIYGFKRIGNETQGLRLAQRYYEEDLPVVEGAIRRWGAVDPLDRPPLISHALDFVGYREPFRYLTPEELVSVLYRQRAGVAKLYEHILHAPIPRVLALSWEPVHTSNHPALLVIEGKQNGAVLSVDSETVKTNSPKDQVAEVNHRLTQVDVSSGVRVLLRTGREQLAAAGVKSFSDEEWETIQRLVKETASLQRMARRQPTLFGSLLSKLIVVIDNPQKAGGANKEESANAFIAALKNANSEALQRIWPANFTPDPTS